MLHVIGTTAACMVTGIVSYSRLITVLQYAPEPGSDASGVINSKSLSTSKFKL